MSDPIENLRQRINILQEERNSFRSHADTLSRNLEKAETDRAALLKACQNLENDDGVSMPASAWELVQEAIEQAMERANPPTDYSPDESDRHPNDTPFPCPYCGDGEPHVEFTFGNVIRFVQCSGCEASGPVGHDRRDAVRQWNHIASAANAMNIAKTMSRMMSKSDGMELSDDDAEFESPTLDFPHKKGR